MQYVFDPNWRELSDLDLGNDFYLKWRTSNPELDETPIQSVPTQIEFQLAIDTLWNETDSAELDRALKLVLSGRRKRGGKIIREYLENRYLQEELEDEVKTGSRRQSKYGKKNQGDTLTRLIYEIVEERHGDLTEAQLLEELRRNEGMGVIEEITDDYIYFIKRDDTGGCKSKISNLRGRLSTAIKKFRVNKPSR